MRAKRPAQKRPLPTWVSALVIAAVVILVAAIFFNKARQPSSRLPRQTPELTRIQQEMAEVFRKSPKAQEFLRRRAGGPGGQQRPAQVPGR